MLHLPGTAIAAVVALAVIGVVFVVFPRILWRTIPWMRVLMTMRGDKRERAAPRRELGAYHDAWMRDHADDGCGREVDARTWRDLDMDDVFRAIDRTKSRPGQQFLHHMLRTPEFAREPLRKLSATTSALTADQSTLKQLRDALARVDDPRAALLVDLIFGNLPERPQLWWMFPMMTLMSVGAIVLTAFYIKALVLVIVMCVASTLCQTFYRPQVQGLLPAIHEIPAFIRAAKRISVLRIEPCVAETDALRDGGEHLSMLENATKWLTFEPTEEASELAASLYGYVNLLLMLDMNAFVFGLNAARVARPRLQAMFSAMGMLDAAQSIVELRTSLETWCEPQLTECEKRLCVDGVVHPLVTNPVRNSLTINNSSVLITGSNMSGKTTFVRALGVNAIFAQSIGTVFATSWRAPFLAVGASIGREDSVMEGKSYYLAEVESVRRLVRGKDDGHQHLFLLDEIFRGTNTPERIAAAFAVLDHLNRGDDIVVVATHDSELLDMLGASYAPRHFRETIADGQLTFDFLMREGRATTRNAIALLELMEYPAELVECARSALSLREY